MQYIILIFNRAAVLKRARVQAGGRCESGNSSTGSLAGKIDKEIRPVRLKGYSRVTGSMPLIWKTMCTW